jgi:dihydroceramidase
MIDPMTGFWTDYGVPASVDWCEPNYVYTPYVAELWNTASSLVIFLAAAIGLVLALRQRVRAEPRFLLGFVGLAVIGLGSAAFHGTLLKLPQATDELPMVWLSLLFVYCLRFRQSSTTEHDAVEASRRRRWRLGLVAYASAFTAAYFTLESYFAFFIATYATIVGYIVVSSWVVAHRRHRHSTFRRLFWASSGAYLGGLFTMWIPERALGCDAAFQAIQPHAWFHLTSLVGTYTWILFALYDRWTLTHASPALSVRPPVPMVAAQRAPTDPG